jgi:hypothetical protein
MCAASGRDKTISPSMMIFMIGSFPLQQGAEKSQTMPTQSGLLAGKTAGIKITR